MNVEDMALDQSLSQRVAVVLEDQILNGRYKPGYRLYEVEIAKELNISRAPIREAYHILQRKGLLEIIPRRGTYVPKISDYGINNLLDLRRAIDGLAAHLAAKRHTSEQLKKMKEILRLQGLAAQETNKREFQEFGQRFHLAICEASQNPKLIQIWQDLSAEGFLFRIRDINFPGAIQESFEEHKELFHAISTGDHDLAQRLAEAHMESLRDRWLSKRES